MLAPHPDQKERFLHLQVTDASHLFCLQRVCIAHALPIQ